MADDLADFQRWIQIKAAEVEDGANALVRTAAASLVTRLVRYTPVDRGVARAGWQVSLSQVPGAAGPLTLPARHGSGLVRVPFPQRLPGRMRATVVGAAFGPVGHASTAEGSNIIQMLKADIERYRGRGIRGGIYVYNSVPYIVFLNQGHSPQASAHFIERAIMEVEGSIGGLKILGG